LPEIEIRSVPVPGHLGWVLTYPFNMLGALPALSVQAGQARSNVPIGVQLVGRPYDDAAVFRAGLAIERARGAWYTDASRRPPPPFLGASSKGDAGGAELPEPSERREDPAPAARGRPRTEQER
jgi:hypothetical protein